MDPAALIPTPDAIVAPWWIFQLLLTITFLLHLVAMNVMVGTTVIALVSHLTGPDRQPGRLVASNLPYTIAFAVNFGVAPLLFVQVLYGHLLYTSSILMATCWLSVIGLLLAGYYAAYVYKYQFDVLRDGRALLTALIAGVLLVVGFFFVNNMTLMLHPESWSRYFDHPQGMLLNTGDPTLLPRYLHFMVSAMAIGGLAIAVYAHTRPQIADRQQLADTGCRWYAHGTTVNIALGLWFYASLPSGLIPATWLGLLFKVLLLVALTVAILSVVLAQTNRPMPALHGALTTIFIMTILRELLRTFYLSPWFSPNTLERTNEWLPLLLFLLFFVTGLYLIVWMLGTVHRALDAKEVRP
jgi:hypothetical protein